MNENIMLLTRGSWLFIEVSAIYDQYIPTSGRSKYSLYGSTWFHPRFFVSFVWFNI